MAGGMYNFKTSSVVQLNSDNFRSMVLDSKETWYADGASRLALYATTLLHCFKALVGVLFLGGCRSTCSVGWSLTLVTAWCLRFVLSASVA